jgi:putative oxidoreductase
MTYFPRHLGRLESRLSDWLGRYSVPLLRLSLGLVFLGFGLLKFVPDLSPAEDLATATVARLSFGLLAGDTARLFVAGLETTIGLCLVTGRYQGIGLALVGVAMLGVLAPLALFPNELFPRHGSLPVFAPTLEAQYVLKDVVLLAGALVLAAHMPRRRLQPADHSAAPEASATRTQRGDDLDRPALQTFGPRSRGTADLPMQRDAIVFPPSEAAGSGPAIQPRRS